MVDVKDIAKNGTIEEKRYLFGFDADKHSVEVIRKKFYLFVARLYPRYFESKKAPFHDEMVEHFIKSYLGHQNYINIGFRGCAKTSMKKLFDVYVLLNDQNATRKYLKVLTRDLTNSRQIVTDVYNLILEAHEIYGDVFDQGEVGDSDKKRKAEQTMKSFTLKNGVKYNSGTVGQIQRGHVQDAYRPDFVWFEDIEDQESVRSIAITQGVISKSDEAIQGMAVKGNYVVTANYISDQGSVQWFLNQGITQQIIPIINQDGVIAWDRYDQSWIEEKKQTADDWEGDYMCNPVASGELFFDRTIIEKALEKAEDAKDSFADVKIWDTYRPDHRYGIGADTSEGIGRDANALVIMDYQKGKVVGTYHNNQIAPDMFGHLMCQVGKKYGDCLLAPELNNTGHATITAIKENLYPLVYKAENTTAFTDSQTQKLGWVMSGRTKNTAFFKFKKDFEDGQITILDRELLEEMRAYTNADLTDAKKGVITRHFDLLIAAVIAWSVEPQAGYVSTAKFKTRY